MHSQKYAFLSRPNRSQVSLSSTNSINDRVATNSSPIDSPLSSPAFPSPPSASPLAIPQGGDNRKSVYEVRNSDFDDQRFSPPGDKPDPPHRAHSQQSPTPTSRPAPTILVAAAADSHVDEPSHPANRDHRQPPPNAGETKKKRRFFGIGDSSAKDSTKAPPKALPPKSSFGRSNSVRTAPPARLTKANPHLTDFSRPGGVPSARFALESTGEAGEPSPSSPHSWRHSVAGSPPPILVEDNLAAAAALASGANDDKSRSLSNSFAPRSTDHDPPLSSWDRASNESTPQNLSLELPYQGTVAYREKGEAPLPRPSSRSSRPPSRQSLDPPSPLYPYPERNDAPSNQRAFSFQSANSFDEATMAPTTQAHVSARSIDSTQQNSQSTATREGYQPYNQNAQGNPTSGQYGSQLSVNQQGTSYCTPQAPAMVAQNSNSEQGRSTPPPSRSRDDLAQLDVQSLLSRHEELNEKYRKVKKYYFEKDAQVQQLQNTLAHQRLAQSRTSLDDNEYMTRFSRLDGAINNLAFNIRKDWRAVPTWLAPYVNKDATNSVTKEMTAVGRACISRWLVDEILDRYFHPGLEPDLSAQLKIIEKNLRRFAPPTPTDEEKEALLAKISNWRLATLDGLQDSLSHPDATVFRADLTDSLVKLLSADLMMNLKDPPPPGLDAGVIGIIELAVGIAANLPLESRDVYVDYIMPGVLVNDAYMKVEGALPLLTNPGEGLPDPDQTSIGSQADKDDTDRDAADGSMSSQQQQQQQQQGNNAGQKKKGMFGGLMAKKTTAGGGTAPPGGAQGSAQGGQGARSDGGQQQQQQQMMPKEDKVRFAAFMSVEVRGKTMLIKAPVYV